ncbi:MAG: response regulator [Candidatus Omnitrophica bacterium]|nr:response regulator [Candidatus Omnitrophota bacterium]
MAKRILMIDDEPDVLEMLGNRLVANHYEVISASTGLEGLEKAQNEKPDLILLDVMMPGMDGLEVLKRLKSSNLTRNIPVLIISAKVQKESIQKAIAAGAVDYFVKPFPVSDLLGKIQKMVA